MKNKIRLLIADDEELFRKYLKTVVDWGENGFEIVGEAKNGLQALEMARQKHPDVLFIDINMPHIDGLALIDTLQKERTDALFVLITGYGDFEHAQRAIKLSVFDYLLKPFTQEELLICLKRLHHYIEDNLRGGNAETRPNIAREHLNHLQRLILGDTSGKRGALSDIYSSLDWEMPTCLRLVQGDLPEKASWAYLLVLRAIKFLCEHYREDLSIDSIAKALFVSPSYLRKVFANELKIPVMRALLELRMDRAARMLTEGSYKIAFVAEQTGYSDPAYFGRVFYKYFGMTPSAFEVIRRKQKL
jgi:two-component system response regulator YesN